MSDFGDNFDLATEVDYLNDAGGFDGALTYEKVAEAAENVPSSKIQKLLKDLEEQKDTIKNPLSWLTSALRKARGGGSGNSGASSNRSHPAASKSGAVHEADQKLRKRIGWLNGEGGFDGAIIYDKVLEASGGLPFAEVMRILKDAEEKRSEVRDPNSWICSALRKSASGAHVGGWVAPAMPPMQSWGSPPASYGWVQPDPAFDSKLRKRVGWLNTAGGFDGGLVAEKVAEAAHGVDLQEVFRILKEVEEKKDEVRDPTAFVTAAFRKIGGGSRSDVAAPQAYYSAPPPQYAPPQFARSQYQPPSNAWSGDAKSEDQKLRKRIGWLNGQGGCGGAIIYDKVLEAAGGLEFSDVFSQLKNLEEKGDSVKDPTAWVCAGLRRLSGQRGVQNAPPQPVAWSGGGFAGDSWGGGAAPMDVDATSKLHKKVKWLNDPRRFNNALDFEKVQEAAMGLDSNSQMQILKELEENKDTVKNPLSYVTSAMRKGGGGRGGGTLGVRKTISKVRH